MKRFLVLAGVALTLAVPVGVRGQVTQASEPAPVDLAAEYEAQIRGRLSEVEDVRRASHAPSPAADPSGVAPVMSPDQEAAINRANDQPLLDPRGTQISPTTALGLLLIRDMYVVQATWIAGFFESVRDGGLAQKRERVRAVTEASGELARLDRAARAARQAYYDHLPDDNVSGQEAARMAREAERLRKEAETKEREFKDALERDQRRFPEIDVPVDDVPLWKALDGVKGDGTKAELDRVEAYGRHLTRGAEDLRRRAEAARLHDTIQELWVYRRPEFQGIRDAVRRQGSSVGSNLPSNLMGEVEKVGGAFDIQAAVDEGWTKVVLAGVGAVGILITPYICLTMSVIDVTMEGDRLVIAFKDADAAREGEPVLGWRHVITAEERANAAQGAFVLAAIGVGLDLAAIRSMRVVGAADCPKDAARIAQAAEGEGAARVAAADAGASAEAGRAIEAGGKRWGHLGDATVDEAFGRPGLSDDAWVHFAGSEVARGIEEEGVRGRSYWARWGEVKNWTQGELRFNIGSMSESGLSDLRTMVVAPENAPIRLKTGEYGFQVEGVTDDAVRGGRVVVAGEDPAEAAARAASADAPPVRSEPASAPASAPGDRLTVPADVGMDWGDWGGRLAPRDHRRFVDLIGKAHREGLTPEEVDWMRRTASEAKRWGLAEVEARRRGLLDEKLKLPDDVAANWLDWGGRLARRDARRFNELLEKAHREGLTADEIEWMRRTALEARRWGLAEMEARQKGLLGDAAPAPPLADVPLTDFDDLPGVLKGDVLDLRPALSQADRARLDALMTKRYLTDDEVEWLAKTLGEAHVRELNEPAPYVFRPRTGAEPGGRPMVDSRRVDDQPFDPLRDASPMPARQGDDAVFDPQRDAAPLPARQPADGSGGVEGVPVADEAVDRSPAGAGGISRAAQAGNVPPPDESERPQDRQPLDTPTPSADRRVSALPGAPDEDRQIAGLPLDLLRTIAPIDYHLYPVLELGAQSYTAVNLPVTLTTGRDVSIQIVILSGPEPEGEETREPSSTRTSRTGAENLAPGGATLFFDADLKVFIQSRGTLGGDAIEMRVFGTDPDSPERISAEGLVAEPIELHEGMKERLEQELRGLAAQNPINATLDAYCLEFLRQPPSLGTVFRIADLEVQRRFAPLRRVLEAGRRLQDSGLLNPDSDPEEYFHSIRQWAVWAVQEHLDMDRFGDSFVELTRKNFQTAGQPWTEQIERLVRSLVPNRWQDISRIITESRSAAFSQ